MENEKSPHRWRIRWLVVFAVLLIVMALTDLVFRNGMNQEHKSPMSVQQVDCASCRWALSYSAFLSDDVDGARLLLSQPKGVSVWSLPMAYQARQLEDFVVLPLDASQGNIEMWGLSVKHKHASPSYSPRAVKRQMIIAFYQSAMGSLS